MSLISTTIPNLVNGVSQQPYSLRLASQAEMQVNGYSSVVEGLRKRPPSMFRGMVSNTTLGKAYIHSINRDVNERYFVIATNGDLRVFRPDGTEVTVNFPDGKSYLAAANPDEAFAAVTVADYTFFLNRTVTVESLPTLSPEPTPEAIVWVKQGGYGLKYSINLGSYGGTELTTADGSAASDAELISTDKIATNLYNGLLAVPEISTDFDVTRAGSSIRIRRKDTGAFDISYSDGLGDQAMKLVKGSVQRFSTLPARGFDGFQVEITGDQSSSFDNYWVKFQASTGNSYNGVWIEAMKGGEEYRLNPATLPYGLIREADGTFTFKKLSWSDREAGDAISNPFPSFVGRTVNDIFFHRNRLGMVADENVIFSASGEFFRFFLSSATQLLDTDPIDVAVSHTKVSILRHAIPFNESLLLFSDQTQFMLGATNLLSPQSVSINQTTEFQASTSARPVGAGQNVYFAVNRGIYSGIREYYVDGDTKTNNANDITAHVPNYIPSGITKLAASTNEDVMVAFSPTEPNALYVYKYYWQEQEKLQSSWSKWEFSTNTKILFIEFLESELWMLVERGGEVYFESMPLEPGAKDTGVDFMFHLDHRFDQNDATVVYDSANDKTLITPPYSVADTTGFTIIGMGTGGWVEGRVIPFEWTGTAFSVRGNVTSFIVGVSYMLRYRFSTLVIKEQAPGGGQMTLGAGRIQLRKLTLTFHNTGYFRTVVTPERRDPYISVFSGRVIGSGRNQLGSPSVEEGRFSFGILGNNQTTTIEIENDSPLPSAFLSAEWEAMYVIRSSRL